jgi:hypothetical protein
MSVQLEPCLPARPGPAWVALSEAAAAIVRALQPRPGERRPSCPAEPGEDD